MARPAPPTRRTGGCLKEPLEPLRVRVYYDFASTICYVAHRVMERMAPDLEALAVELVWTPVDLVRITGWPRGGEIDGPRADNALRVASDLDVPVRLPTRWPDSRRANATALALAGSDGEPIWRERVFSAVHEQGRDLDDAEVVAGMARDVGLDPASLATGDAFAALDAETDRARESEVTGVPTFMLDGWPFGGIQEEFTMRTILARWATKKRQRGPPTGPCLSC